MSAPLKNLVISVAIFVILILAFIFFISKGSIFPSNFAQQEVVSITQKLQAAGAEAWCSYGDSGYSIDNKQPWYVQYLVFNGDYPTALSQAKSVASEHGYALVKGSELTTTQREEFGFATDQEFNDTQLYATRESNYSELQKGNGRMYIERPYGFENEESFTPQCSEGPHKDQALQTDKTVISIELRLPDTK